MLRDAMMPAPWWDKWIQFDLDEVAVRREDLKSPSMNPEYRPQFVFGMVNAHLSVTLRRYCRGDPVRELGQHVPPLLDAWEEAERLGASIWTPEIQHSRHAWTVNLDHYIRCFWLTGLALALDLPEGDWQRLVKLMGNEGQDALLDRVIATRQSGRPIGDKLCHPKPYQRLLDAVNAPSARQPELLREFVTHWYRELDRPPKKGLSRMTAMYERPYWYDYDKADGAYFGFWCIEAVAAVKALGIDDRLCLGLPNYPGDLLRPDGPPSHTTTPTAPTQDEAPTSATPSLTDRMRRALFGLR